MILEVCVENLAEALKAEALGANRIELCDNLAVGGTTPSIGTIITCKKQIKIPVMVMIRPRGGDFIYTPDEVDSMLLDIKACKDAGADGIVTGVLTADGKVDLKTLKLLVELADRMEITFHKAIDETRDILKETLGLRNSGVYRILSSGGAPTALEGADMLNSMIQLTAGRIVILAAGKITALNLQELSLLIHTHEFHGRKIVGELI